MSTFYIIVKNSVNGTSSPTLEHSKNFHITRVADSPSAGCSATKVELETMFESCFENFGNVSIKNSAMDLLFSNLQAFKLQPLTLPVLKITESP